MLSLDIILATYNGATTLPLLFEGYLEQNCAALDWRLVIVDNASTDATSEIIESYKDRLPILNFHCSDLGKNRALNCALDRLQPDRNFYIFTDDDAVPQPGFLAAWHAALSSDGGSDRIYGGAVVPKFLAAPPAHVWDFRSHFEELYAENVGRECFSPDDIYGPNMCVPGRVIGQGMRFDERIGPNSSDGQYPMGSETEFCTRVSSQFLLQPTFVADAKVNHIVRESQTSLAFVKSRAFRHGRGSALQLYIGRGRLAVLREAYRLYLGNGINDRGSAEALWNEQWRRGFLSEALSMQPRPFKFRSLGEARAKPMATLQK